MKFMFPEIEDVIIIGCLALVFGVFLSNVSSTIAKNRILRDCAIKEEATLTKGAKIRCDVVKETE